MITYDFMNEDYKTRQKRSVKRSDTFKGHIKNLVGLQKEELSILNSDAYESRYGIEFNEFVFKVKVQSERSL